MMQDLPLRPAELLVLAALTVCWPAYEYLYGWPDFLRRVATGKSGVRESTYREAMLIQWTFVGACIVVWRANGRTWGAPAMDLPSGARLWGSVCLLALLVALQGRQLHALSRAHAARASLARKIASMPFLPLLPRSRRELAWMYPLCVTAGFCEELLYRGFVVWALSIPLGWWGANAASVLAFGLLHAYQGWTGVLRTSAVGLLMTAVVAVTRSLWPAMVLHALIDAGSVTLLYMVIRTEAAEGSAVTLGHE